MKHAFLLFLALSFLFCQKVKSNQDNGIMAITYSDSSINESIDDIEHVNINVTDDIHHDCSMCRRRNR